ncbi:MAG: toll/interleukin-1 receptor domain-containing protein, partial [Chloroflexota bacterium]
MNALTTPNKTLFLSYSRRQTEWCDKLYTAIDTYTHYYRWRDNKIPESADWWDSICLNIEGCYAFVAILSQDYLDSVYCMGELEYALKLNKPVIALMLQDVDYPQKLNERRLQFAQVSGLDMPQVINKVLSAANQITLGYMQDDFSTDIHSRKHLRPTVPTPKEATPTPEEDEILEEQIKEVAKHGQIPTRDLLRRYSEEKERNIILARELLDKIMERVDVPVFFDIVEEDQELYNAEQIF